MGKKIDQTENNKQMVYMTFLQREMGSVHHSYDEELLQYEYLRDGDMRAIEESKRLFRGNLTGKLSKDPIRSRKYLFVAAITLATRFAIEGGMEAQYAYMLSDMYIQQADECKDEEQLNDLQTEMITDYTVKMREIHKEQQLSSKPVEVNFSKPIWEAMDYIYYHLHDKILLEDIGKAVGLSPNYLSTLFKNEKGITIRDYIRKRRIEAAENMILYSSYSETDIAEFLAFANVSHFIRVFRQETGYTPKQYLAINFRRHAKWSMT